MSDLFRFVTKERLDRWRVPRTSPIRDLGDWERLCFEHPTGEQLERYGNFSITVHYAGNQLRSHRPPDKAGIHWQLVDLGPWDQKIDPHWCAAKFYANVELTWWTDDVNQKLDERWERLDAILQRLSSS